MQFEIGLKFIIKKKINIKTRNVMFVIRETNFINKRQKIYYLKTVQG